MKKLISLLIALLIGALASWNTPKARVTPQNAGFETITAEVGEELTAEEEPPAETLVKETETEEEQAEPTAVLIEPKETATSIPELPAEPESKAADETSAPEEPTQTKPGEERKTSPITEPERNPGANTDTDPTIEEAPTETIVVEKVIESEESIDINPGVPQSAAEPIFAPDLGKRPYEEPVDEHGIRMNADDLLGPDGLRCGEGIHS